MIQKLWIMLVDEREQCFGALVTPMIESDTAIATVTIWHGREQLLQAWRPGRRRTRPDCVITILGESSRAPRAVGITAGVANAIFDACRGTPGQVFAAIMSAGN